MRKRFMTAMFVAAIATTTFAQNADGLKQVLSAGSYSDAVTLVDAAKSTMTSQERAKAYKKLEDLAISESNAADEAAVKAQLAKDDATFNAKSKEKADAACAALQAAFECNKADNEPNDKGQIKPKFQSKNASRLLIIRNTLVDPALNAYNSKDYASAKKYFGAYIEARQNDLFAKTDFSKEQNYGQISYYGALAAFFDKDYETANKYADIAIDSKEEIVNDAVTLKINVLEELVKAGSLTKEAYEEQLNAFYAKMPNNEAIFSKLYSAYTDNGKQDKADALINDRLAANPNDVMANALQAQTAQNNNDFEKAISAYGKAIAAKPDFLAAKMNLGVCYLNRAQTAINDNTNDRGAIKAEAKPAIIEDLKKAKAILEEVKAADPNKEQTNWAYPLERVNYALENIQ